MPRSSAVPHILIIAVLASCSNSSTSEPTSSVARVAVTPATTNTTVGQTFYLSAKAYDAHDQQLTGLSARWESADSSVVSPAGGALTAIRAGTTQISATMGGVTGNATVVVLDAPPPTNPSGRWLAGMAFDAAHGEALLFGGRNATGALGDLWGYDGAHWVRHAFTGGPAPRAEAILAFDAANNRVLLYGGSNATGTPFTDTWAWNGTSWSQLATTGPTPRQHANGGYDAHRARFVIHGGQSPAGSVLHDTWEWDGTAWTQASNTTPDDGWLPSPGAYLQGTERLMMMVSNQTGAEQSELWAWSGTSWSVAGTLPGVSTPGNLVATGSSDLIFLDDSPTQTSTTSETFYWDGAAWTHLAVTNPPARSGAAMTYAPTANGHVVVLFGGVDHAGNYLADTWLWNGSAWTRL